ncbi:MAG: TIGR03118 family protein [Burkholderiales bacterium]|nr:TIGR03118 family protein [Burkholderiales bacterium]
MHNFMKSASRLSALAFSVTLVACGGSNDVIQANSNTYVQSTFVSNNSTSYQPTTGVDPSFIDAWGIAIRPAGQPGHFWVLAGNKSFEYVGDVSGKIIPPCTSTKLCADLAPLSANTISFPDFPSNTSGQPDIIKNHATGVVFNSQPSSFVITQTPSSPSTNTAQITAGAKFLFATNFGAIYAWTERKHADGSGYDRADTAVKVFDTRLNSNDCGQFYGLAISPTSDRLYAADFGRDTSGSCNNPDAIAAVPASFKIRIFDKTLQADGTLKEITSTLYGGKPFMNPFVADQEHIQAGDFVPWNVQVVGSSVFVTYVQVQQNPNAPVGTPFTANEVHAPGAGRLVEFNLDGGLIGVWNDVGMLNAPWGLAAAPSNFGALSNTLLVGNFGDYDAGGSKGAITAFDRHTRKAVNYVRNKDGSPMLIPGIWGMTFGNGDTLGDSNALYFASGPNGELDGLFGSLRYSAP